jgi:hypothetical protein
MTLEQAKKAKENRLYVCHTDNPSLNGIISCFDDDKTGFYYKPTGRGYTPVFAMLEQMQLVN